MEQLLDRSGVMRGLADAGWWSYDAATGDVQLGEAASRTLGLPPRTRLAAGELGSLLADVLGVAGAQAADDRRTDALTGIPSRRVLSEALGEAGRRAADERLALVLLDLDRFSDVNDTYGHRAGDAVLIEVAQRLRRTVRGGELVARVGGERFAWLLSGTDPQQATAAADRARAAIACRPFRGAGALTISAGIGVVEPPFDGAMLHELAERALADAKRQGRNRSCCAIGVVAGAHDDDAGSAGATAAAA